MTYRRLGFLAVIRFCYSSSPTPPPSLDSKHDRRHTGRLRKRDKMLTGEGGGVMGKEPNHTTVRKHGPQYSMVKITIADYNGLQLLKIIMKNEL
jgi:hypothetical protein